MILPPLEHMHEITNEVTSRPCVDGTWYMHRQTVQIDGKTYERDSGARYPTVPDGHFYSLNRDIRCGRCLADAFRVRGLGYDGALCICVVCGHDDEIQ